MMPKGPRYSIVLLTLSLFLTAVCPLDTAYASNTCASIFSSNTTDSAGAIGDFGTYASINKYVAFTTNSTDLKNTLSEFQIVESRGKFDGADLPDFFESPIAGGQAIPLDLSFTYESKYSSTHLKNSSLEKLYAAYDQQGEGRSNNIETYQGEDQNQSSRTTHYTLSSAKEPMAHIQAQYSKNSAEPLNLELHFPEARDFIRGREKNSAAVELGRFLIMGSEHFKDNKNRELLSSKTARHRIFNLLWLNILPDLQSLDQNTVFVFQTNQGVFRILSRAFGDVSLENHMIVESSSSGSKEYITKLTHSEIVNLTKHFARLWLSDLLKDFLNKTNSPHDRIKILIPEKLESTLRELNIYAELKNQDMDEAQKQLEFLGVSSAVAKSLTGGDFYSSAYQRAELQRAKKTHFVIINADTAARIIQRIGM